MIENIAQWLFALARDISLFTGIFVGKLFLMAVLQGIMFLAINVFSRGIDDKKLLWGYWEGDEWVPPSTPYRLYRGMLVAAQFIPSATLAYIPWGIVSGDWTLFKYWELGGNFGFILVFLLLRFVILEKILLRTENNLLAITNRIKPNMALLYTEGAAMMLFGLVLAGLASGESKDLHKGIYVSIALVVICLGVFTGWMVWRLRQKVHTFDGVGGQSLSDGIKNGNMRAAALAIGHITFICMLLFGSVLGEFTSWAETIRITSITLIFGLIFTIVLNRLLQKHLIHLDEKVDERYRIPTAIVSNAALAGLVLWVVGGISGSLATL